MPGFGVGNTLRVFSCPIGQKIARVVSCVTDPDGARNRARAMLVRNTHCPLKLLFFSIPVSGMRQVAFHETNLCEATMMQHGVLPCLHAEQGSLAVGTGKHHP
ncbi:LolA-like protein [Novacetimonas cocois]|uniref:Uncharacterized protein n=1 Tax=Novacetimonas cocois TaxID=1747507 RepID=A0A365Z097_9PROT|nr:hypothetical protein [Novacetimonas cocois]RBM08286.1 hypothetical protein NJLHNGOC_05095 [Novacetimonas cocois]